LHQAAVRIMSALSDAELVDAFSTSQQARSLAAATIKRRRATLSVFARYMTPASITTATLGDVEHFLAGLHTAATRHHYRSDLKMFFRWAQRRGIVAGNPVELTDGVRSPKSVPRPAAPETVAAAYMAANERVQLAILLGALAGLRVGEIVSLHADDVRLDLDPAVLLVRQGKGGKDRIVPVHPTLVRHLRGRTGWLFASRVTGRPVRAQSLSVAMKKALTINGVRVTAHQLRHAFGTEAARWSNGNLVLVGKLMGHESPTTTMGYVGWNPEAGAEVVARIDAGLGDELAERRSRRSVVV
jgi:integrase/recombinase XerD